MARAVVGAAPYLRHADLLLRVPATMCLLIIELPQSSGVCPSRPRQGKQHAMTDEPENTAASNEPPLWLSATAQDFGAVDLNEPIAQNTSVEAYTLSRISARR